MLDAAQRGRTLAARFVAVLEVVRGGTVLDALAYDDDPERVCLDVGRFVVTVNVEEQ